MKRAALIITDTDGSLSVAESVNTPTSIGVRSYTVRPSEQLLADLRRVCDLAWGNATGRGDVNTIAHVRALLPEEDKDE